MNGLKGTIALDIDGTLTTSHRELNSEVKKLLEEVMRSGWQCIFLTGRTFAFAWQVLSSLEGNFYFSVQNGASLYQMPAEKKMLTHYLSHSSLALFENYFSSKGQGFVIESGRENKDICYYKTLGFSKEDLEYLEYRKTITPENWEEVSTYSTLPLTGYPVAKFYVKEGINHKIAEEITHLTQGQSRTIVISDPFRPGYYIVMATHPLATKGDMIDYILKQNLIRRPLIAAGDDFNDVGMLKCADVKIVMGNAPQEMHSLASILARPVQEDGIIPALKEALEQC